MNRDSLLNKLTMLDFVAVDLQLYLDTHPDDTEVIKKYNSTVSQAEEVRCQYEAEYGPLCSFRSASPAKHFKWIDCPWPWKCDFNYYLKGEDC